MNLKKYPRTFHVPFSPGVGSDDKIVKSDDFINLFDNEIVITEKMDGENTTIYRNYSHARSLDSPFHWSRSRVKSLQAKLAADLPEGIRICGENCFAEHSIKYTTLSDFFLAFSVWEDDLCLSWEKSVEWFDLLEISHVPVIFRGRMTPGELLSVIADLDTTRQEGIVIRNAGSFHFDDFSKNVMKWVRQGHVTSADHWRSRSDQSTNKLKM